MRLVRVSSPPVCIMACPVVQGACTAGSACSITSLQLEEICNSNLPPAVLNLLRQQARRRALPAQP